MLMNERLDVSWPCGIAAQETNLKSGQKVEEGDSAPLLFGETSVLEECIQLRGAQHEKDMDLLEWIQRKAGNVTRGLENRESWGCSDWRGESSRETLWQPFNIHTGLVRKRGAVYQGLQ
ncbi:hypothetical protein BTVI_03071 [Pitangus sulphuratus]|nr:hypothetical protein BTVI_03071 [Pitangus sulphuratus]